jgi:PAS domain-containing protein
MTARTPQKSIVLILARELASKLATAMFLVDPEGTLVYYNEQAEALLGETYADAGEMKRDEWSSKFSQTDLDGSPIPPDDLPLGVSLTRQIPAHRRFRITAVDGVERVIDVTALPLFARAEEFVGAMAIFWEDDHPGPS